MHKTFRQRRRSTQPANNNPLDVRTLRNLDGKNTVGIHLYKICTRNTITKAINYDPSFSDKRKAVHAKRRQRALDVNYERHKYYVYSSRTYAGSG